ncbi:MAG: DNA polymerase III subunit delta [Prevotellaceae bacterium]|jgi:DNA polymerase-3 subunit delta|nr:DNA polymerase III subunit delta [Prevotellaceae bacterium]
MAKKEGITYEHIINELQQKIYKPIYLLMGAEAYYIDKISDFIEQNILSDSEKDFNQTILYGLDTDVATIINTAKRFPMMSEHQVVIVKEAQNIKKDWDNLSYYLQNPLRSTVLVICHKYGMPDKRLKWVKEIEKVGVVFESSEIPDYEIENWVKSYAHGSNIEMDSKAVAMLCDFLGTNLTKIVNELDKLIITLPAGTRKITAEHIEKNIGISKDYNVFELQDAIVQKNALKANRIVRYFADNSKANPIQMVLPQLFNFFANILLYHYLPAQIKIGENENFNEKRAKSLEIGRALGIPPYPAADKVATAARNYNAWKTMNIIGYLREADARSKGFGTANNDANEIYKELIFKMLH